MNNNEDISVSGVGSSRAATKKIRLDLPELLKSFNVKTLLDLPCGDYHWMQHVDLHGIEYTGADIQEERITDNKQKYPGIHFEVLDITTSSLPKNDVVLVRDCLVHLDNKSIWKAIKNLKKSGSTYLLTTNFPLIIHSTLNKNIKTGGWRPLNFRLKPFNFPDHSPNPPRTKRR